METVWVSVWRLLVRVPRLLTVLQEKGTGILPFWFLAVLSVSHCVISPNRCLGGQLPPAPALTSWCL